MATATSIKNEIQARKTAPAAKAPSVSAMMNDFLDGEKLRARFNEVLGKRAPQFVSALVSLINADTKMTQCFFESPMTVVQSALKAATYDLPIDQNLGFAYLVPFKNKQDDGKYRHECTFILGYKGMEQLAMRTGVYERLSATAVHEGELKHFDYLKEDYEFDWIQDVEEREKAPIIGYAAYFRLKNGMEKTVYMSKKQIEDHEVKHRKGKYKNSVWTSNEGAMCEKTVIRKLLGKWGIMSIDYRTADESTLNFASALATGTLDDTDMVDMETTTYQQYSEVADESNSLTVDENGEVKIDA